ncbi:MAG: M1 family metallopeptidase, partial [Deltaproteobacteria bacterium]|nr:M1 family metallopeptidase [Deltaproteobacteria bacterium]
MNDECEEGPMTHGTPIHYRIHLEPDLKRFRFDGFVEILIDISTPQKEITLDALDLAIRRCQAGTEGDWAECSFCVDPGKEKLRVLLPGERGGRIDLRIEFSGEINNRMAGFYRSRYVHGGVEKYAAVTQFEESDARRAFPCFDHPARKATFDVEMVIDEDLVALSNAPAVQETLIGDGRKQLTFQRTPRMSTYLLFLGVGEFDLIEQPGPVLIRLAAMPGLTRHGEYALDFGRKALLFSENYYGIPYPLPKLDLIAISDFAAGAMENWGAITFRENLLLRDPEKTSRAGEERICEVIAHEMAHQWFGNLVTPAEWKYLWLNESFATYFGYGVVDHYHPEWEVWGRFLQNMTNVALDRDALRETFAIEIPGGEHVVINVGTAPIIYNKGGSILRQIEGYVGSEGLKEGLRRYLKAHAYGCAASNDLWAAFEEVSAKPVSRMIRSWIEQPGYPMIEVRREEEGLVLTQGRFTYLPHESDQEWMIPVAVKVFLDDGSTRTIRALIEGRSAGLQIGEHALAYMVNEGQTGFYRVKYTETGNLRELGTRVAGKVLLPEERWGLQNDLYALVKRGDVSLDEYLAFLGFYEEEDDPLPLMSIGDHLCHAFMVTGGERRRNVASLGKALLERVLGRIGYEPVSDERHTLSILREQCLWQAALYGSEDAVRFGQEQFHVLFSGKAVHPDLMRSAVQIGALHGQEDTFDWLDRTFTSSDNEHERINILTAMGCFRDEALIRKVLQYTLGRVPDRNKFMVIGAMAANPYALPFLWEWFLSSLRQLEQLPPVHFERVVAALVPWSGLGREGEVKAFFEDYMAGKEKARDVIRLS